MSRWQRFLDAVFPFRRLPVLKPQHHYHYSPVQGHHMDRPCHRLDDDPHYRLLYTDCDCDFSQAAADLEIDRAIEERAASRLDQAREAVWPDEAYEAQQEWDRQKGDST